jgi:hypothetical protein
MKGIVQRAMVLLALVFMAAVDARKSYMIKEMIE